MNLSSLSAPLSLILSGILVISPIEAQVSSGAPPAPYGDLQIRIEGDGDTSAIPGSRQAKPISVQVLDGSGSPVADAAVAVRLPDSGPSGIFPDGSHSLVVYTDARGEAQITGIQWGEAPGMAAVHLTATKGESHAGTLLERQISLPQPPAPATATAATAPSVSVARSTSAPAPASAVAPASPAAVAQRLLPGTYPANPEPSVSITNFRHGEINPPSFHSGHTKWIILAVVAAAGAGTAVALMNKGKSTSSSTTSSITIGAPTVSVGAP